MDLIKNLGELALGSRLKRLSDQIMRDGVKIYKASNIDFEPRWFPVFYLLSQKSSLGVTEIADELGIKHPSVSQTLNEMEKKGLVASSQCEVDGRKRLSSLTTKAKKMLPKMEPVWRDIADAIHDMLVTHHQNLLRSLEEVENDFSEKAFYKRVLEKSKTRQLEEVEILDYQPQLKSYFRDLNYEWIEKYFTIEDVDKEQLNHPDQIINDGGKIIFAKYGGAIVGTCAMIKVEEGVYELAKMAVTEDAKGKQIGKKLGVKVVEAAKDLGARKLILESNKKLTPALTLYRKIGFKEVDDAHESVYCRANIKMEMDLKS